MRHVSTSLALIAAVAISTATAFADERPSAPAGATLLAQYEQPDTRYAPPPPVPQALPYDQAASSRVWVIPPRDGVVYLYDGQALISTVDRPSAINLPAGRSYGAVSVHEHETAWSGLFTTSPGTVTLRFRGREAPSVIRQQAGVNQGYPGGQPQGYGGPPVAQPPYAYPGAAYPGGAYGGGPQAVTPDQFGSILGAVDQRPNEPGKLAYLSDVASQNRLTSVQVAQILGRFSSEDARLQALTALRACIVDPENRGALLQYFGSFGARRQAAGMLDLH